MTKPIEISDNREVPNNGSTVDSVERDWSHATSGEIAAEVLRVFPGSYLTGSRLVDPAECPDAQQHP